MKNSKFNLAFTLLAATALTTTACQKAPPPQPLTANNDFACRDQEGRIVDDDRCDPDSDGYNPFLFLWLSSNGYNSKYGKYPKGYSSSAYKGKTTSSFAKSIGSRSAGSSTVSRGGFGSTGRGMSAGS